VLPVGYTGTPPTADPGPPDGGYRDLRPPGGADDREADRRESGAADDEEDAYEDPGYDDDGEQWDGEQWHDDPPGRGPGPAGGGVAVRRRRRGRRRHPVLVGFVVLLLVVILLAGGGVLWAAHQIDPSGHEGPDILVTIPAGSSSNQIGADLAKAGVIHAGKLFRYYVKVEGGSPLLSGTYRLAKNESYDQVITTLQAGPVVITDKLVIPEGFTLRQIADRVAQLPDMHLSAAKFLALSSSGSVRSPLEPKGVNNLEGLVFPATYTLARTDTESTILEEMVGTFDQRMAALGLAAGAAKLHMTPYKVITVASIIQGEAKFHGQFPDVASVIYNRLRAKMTLGTDSTLVYALRLANPNVNLSKVTYEEKSPYNTRLHKGLPPTPIDSPSLEALAAAITPPHTNLKYFLAVNSTGNLSFASTDAGFQKLVTKCKANHSC
jgi:UPF0755 protein